MEQTQTKGFQGLGQLNRLLPTGTLFLFQFLNPLLTNNGMCGVRDKVLTSIVISFLGFFCFFSCFTDSYTGADRKVYQGIVTFKGLASFGDPNPEATDLTKYKLRPNDLVHAFFSILVFGILSLLDPNTVSCLYPSFKGSQKLLLVLPIFVGGAASVAFLLFPTKRHGVGYTTALARSQGAVHAEPQSA